MATKEMMRRTKTLEILYKKVVIMVNHRIWA